MKACKASVGMASPTFIIGIRCRWVLSRTVQLQSL